MKWNLIIKPFGMFTTEDFITQYEKKTTEELLNMHANISGYSAEAQAALEIVIENKGGLANLLKEAEYNAILLNEEKRISKETEDFCRQGIDIAFVKTVTKSIILSDETVKEIIENKYAQAKAEKEDAKINPRTIVGGLVGGGIASIIGGVLWGLQMIYSPRVFYLLFVGLVLLCYYTIKLVTKQSSRNHFVIIATIIAVILAVVIGQLLYQIVGYKE